MPLRWLIAGTLIYIFSGSIQMVSAPAETPMRHETPTERPAVRQQTVEGQSADGASSAVVLRAHLLVTSDGGEPGGTGLFAEKYPKTITVEAPAEFFNRIAAYGAAYSVWIAPKDWTGSASVRFDGSTDVNLYPINTLSSRGPRLHYENSGGCAGCAIVSAAPYFPSAMRQWKEFFSYSKLSPLPHGLKITRVSPKLVTYSYPSGDDLLSLGAAHFDPSGQFFEQAEFVLPRTDARLLNFLLQRFISTRKLR